MTPQVLEDVASEPSTTSNPRLGEGPDSSVSKELNDLKLDVLEVVTESFSPASFPSFASLSPPDHAILNVEIASESDHDSDSEYESDSSTIVYDHEPFEKFQTQVLTLCYKLFDKFSDDISVERKRGGGFNRIIGISLVDKENFAVKEYILRVPRFDAAQLDSDLAPLHLLRHSKIKVPKVFAFDSSIENELASPYMIQTRIPGAALFPTYPGMAHEVKCAIAKELGNVFYELDSIRSVDAGNLTLSLGSLKIQSFHSTEASPYQSGPAGQKPPEMIRDALEYQRKLSLETDADAFRTILFDFFITVESEMSAFGILDGDYYSLCHLDLEPCNILASPPMQTQPQAITGILDWDSAIFAPPFVACTPPMWLWAWNDEDDENERLANDIPPTPEFREIKQQFEDAAGEAYKSYAYKAEYRLARRLMRFAIEGLQTNEDFMAAEELLEEWAALKKTLTNSQVTKVEQVCNHDP